MLIGGVQPVAANDFLNYVLKIKRRDFRTGELLTARGFAFTRRFKGAVLDPMGAPLGYTMQGAADGSESSLPS